MTPEQFDDIRSYTQEEIPSAMQFLADDYTARKILTIAFGEDHIDEATDMLRKIKSTTEFQQKIMSQCKRWVVENTLKCIETQGFETIQDNKAYLFTSNHRDITLDAFLLQMSMLEYGLTPCHIAYGTNLLLNKTIGVFTKANNMFKVERSRNIKELAINSRRLSEYIRILVRQNKSMWIAQRNGRTKDGNDKTDHGIITMFSMSGDRNDLITNLSELNITPVAISYEFEPCAMMKARERYITERDGKYVKQPSEDMDSVISGIWKKKGIMNIAICRSITREDLNEYEGADKREIIQAVADLIDKRIYENYRLYPNNFIAHDWLSGSSTFKKHYTEEDKDIFKAYCDKIFSKLYEELGSEAETRFTEILLGIYANPVENKMNLHR